MRPCRPFRAVRALLSAPWQRQQVGVGWGRMGVVTAAPATTALVDVVVKHGPRRAKRRLALVVLVVVMLWFLSGGGGGGGGATTVVLHVQQRLQRGAGTGRVAAVAPLLLVLLLLQRARVSAADPGRGVLDGDGGGHGDRHWGRGC